MSSLRDIYDYYFTVTGESYIKTTCYGKSEAFRWNRRSITATSKKPSNLRGGGKKRAWATLENTLTERQLPRCLSDNDCSMNS
jgi:hypothetical protein